MIFLISLISNAVAILPKCSKLITVRVPLTISLIVDSRTPAISASFFLCYTFLFKKFFNTKFDTVAHTRLIPSMLESTM